MRKQTILRILLALFILPFIAWFLFAAWTGLFGHVTFIFTDIYGWNAFLFVIVGLAMALWWVWIPLLIGILITGIMLYRIKKSEKQKQA